MVEVGRDFLPTFSSAEKVGRVRLRRIRNRRSFDCAQGDSGRGGMKLQKAGRMKQGLQVVFFDVVFIDTVRDIRETHLAQIRHGGVTAAAA